MTESGAIDRALHERIVREKIEEVALGFVHERIHSMLNEMDRGVRAPLTDNAATWKAIDLAGIVAIAAECGHQGSFRAYPVLREGDVRTLHRDRLTDTERGELGEYFRRRADGNREHGRQYEATATTFRRGATEATG